MHQIYSPHCSGLKKTSVTLVLYGNKHCKTYRIAQHATNVCCEFNSRCLPSGHKLLGSHKLSIDVKMDLDAESGSGSSNCAAVVVALEGFI